VILLLLCGGALGAEPTAEELVAEFRSIRIPWGLSEEEADRVVRERCGRQCELALELSRRFPEHEAVPELMLARWTMLLTVFEDPKRALEETAAAPERLAAEAALAAAYATLEAPEAPSDEKLKRLRAAAGAAKSKRHREFAAFLMAAFARDHVASPAKQREICEKAVEEYGRAAALDAREVLAALERVGKALEIPEGRVLFEGERPEAEYVIVHCFSAFDGRIRKDLRELRAGLARLPAGRARVEGVLLYDDEMQVERARKLERECGFAWPVRVAPEDGPDGWWSRLGFGRASFVLLDRERKVVALAGPAWPAARGAGASGEGLSASRGRGRRLDLGLIAPGRGGSEEEEDRQDPGHQAEGSRTINRSR